MQFGILLVLTLSILTKQEVINWSDSATQEVYFNGKYYEFEILKDGVNNLRHMLYDLNHDRLYYIYFLYNSDPTTRAAYIDTMNNNIVQILEIENPRMVAKDYKNDFVFMGTKNGIYRLCNEGNATKLGVNDNIVALYVKGVLYYVNVKKEAFQYANGDVDKVPELITYDVDSLIVDGHEDKFFLSYRRLHKTRVSKKRKTVIVPFERHIVRSMSVDVHGDVYVCAMDGIFVYDRLLKGLRKVSELTNIEALTFNRRNEPIISYADKIIKLKEKPTLELLLEYRTL
ncbi:Ommochrome-binding protein [Eumeta japonica]|uniref:Ommochrome-binding protein n=1 Tax=Eumeta variegata TaxID=151549 RepID=A0A4C1ZR15_EUMVA|nr:Ommochrome-binding protein [Eumeta japonica]